MEPKLYKLEIYSGGALLFYVGRRQTLDNARREARYIIKQRNEAVSVDIWNTETNTFVERIVP